MMNQHRRVATLVVTVCALALLGSAAHANDIVLKIFKAAGAAGPAGDVEVTNDPDLAIGYGHRLVISVTRDAGVWANTALVLEGTFGDTKSKTFEGGPDLIAVYGSAASGALYAPTALVPANYAPVAPSVSHIQPRWTLPSSNLAQAETITLELGFAFDGLTTLKGTPISLRARLTGTKGGSAVDLVVNAPGRTGAGELSGAISAKITRIAGFQDASLGAGLLVRYRIGVTNTGAIGLRPPSGGHSVDYQVTVPSKLRAFRIFSSEMSNPLTDQPGFIGGSPATPGSDQVDLDGGASYSSPTDAQLTGSAPTDLRAYSDKKLLRRSLTAGANVDGLGPGTYDGASDWVVVDAFVSCDNLLYTDRSDSDWQLVVDATARDYVYSGAPRALALAQKVVAFTHLADGVGAVETCAEITRVHTQKLPDWDHASNAQVRNGQAIGMGEVADYSFNITPPLGAAEIVNATIVDRLPIATSYRIRVPNADGAFTATTAMKACTIAADCNASGTSRGSCVDNQCESLFGLRAYFCNTPSDFGAEQWSALRSTGACVPAVRSADGRAWVPPSGMTPTHAVLHAGVMGPRAWGEDSFGTLAGTVSMTTTVGGVMENTIWLSGTYNTGPSGSGGVKPVATDYGLEPEGTPDTAVFWRDRNTTRPFEDDGFYRVVDYQCLSASTELGSGGVLDTGAPSPANCGYAKFGIAARDVNPPALNGRVEIDVPEGVTVPLASATTVPCPGGNVAPTWSGDAADPLVWDLPADCVLDEATRFWLYVCAEASYPFVDGQSVPFSLRLTRVVNGPKAGDVCSTNGTSGGVDDGDGTAEANESGNPTTAFVMRVLGRQVATITPVCSTSGHAAAFRVVAQNPAGKPLTNVALQFAVPAGTTFAAVSSSSPTSGPNAATIAYSADGTSWQATPPSPASSVAYVRLAMPTLVPYTGEGSFVVELDAPGSGAIAPVATLTSSLGATPATSIPFALGSCRPLTVSKFFDADGDGVKAGASELALSGWTFTVRGISGAPGDAGVQVASGTTDAAGAWSIQLPAGQYLVHEEPATATAPVSWVTAPDQTVVFSNTVNVGGATLVFGNHCECTSLACRVATCTSLGGQGATCDEESTNVSCADADDCTIDTCAEPGGCAHDPVPCATPGFFAPVTDDLGNVIGAIRCVRSGAGEVTCDEGPDTDGDGRLNLVIFPEYADRCGAIP